MGTITRHMPCFQRLECQSQVKCWFHAVAAETLTRFHLSFKVAKGEIRDFLCLCKNFINVQRETK